MKNKTLTKKQFETLDYLTKYFDEHQYMPSHSEISKRFKIEIGGGTMNRLDVLVKKGYIKIWAGQSRGITLIKQNNE